MKTPIVLDPEVLSGLPVYISPLFVACNQFVIRKSLLGNVAIFPDAEAVKGLNSTFSAETAPMASVEDTPDESLLAFFSNDKTLGKPRLKITRTAWYISDEEGDAVLFTSADGQSFIFERRLVDMFGLTTLYMIADPQGEDPTFTDVDTPDMDGNVVISACEVKLPPKPNIAAWAAEKPEKAEKKKGGKKAEAAVAAAPATPTVPTSGAPDTITAPPADEALSLEEEEDDSTLGPPTVGIG